MKNALEAYKIRLQWHLRRFKKIIGIYDKIFIAIFNYYIYFFIIHQLFDFSYFRISSSSVFIGVYFTLLMSQEKYHSTKGNCMIFIKIIVCPFTDTGSDSTKGTISPHFHTLIMKK